MSDMFDVVRQIANDKECLKKSLVKGEPDLNGPYYPAISLNDGTEICVSRNLSGNDHFPVLDVRVEAPDDKLGFKTLRLTCPYMEIMFNDGFTEEETIRILKTVGNNVVLLFDISDRGWGDA